MIPVTSEQASGKTADRRADIWSFGAVLYEMLTGQKAFEGESVSDTLASVLKLDPDWDALPSGTRDLRSLPAAAVHPQNRIAKLAHTQRTDRKAGAACRAPRRACRSGRSSGWSSG